MSTISTNHTLGVGLNAATYANPVTIEAGVTITNIVDSEAVYVFGAPTYIVLQNDGRVSGSYTGVFLPAGGTVTNAAGASITGGARGVVILNGDEIVVNAGTIQAGGSHTYSDAISLSSGLAIVANSGRIAGIGAQGDGVMLESGGSITNATSGTITGTLNAIYARNGAGTLFNYGNIAAAVVGANGVDLRSGGFVMNAGSASIVGSLLIGGPDFGGLGSLVNYGRITGAGGYGSVYLGPGSSVTNEASGSISEGVTVGIAGPFAGSPGTIVNYGSIGGRNAGVYLDFGGSITNEASASITGGAVGVALPYHGGTLTNAGTIIGSTGTAVVLGSTGSNLLLLDPGFDFSGAVIGSTRASNTLELAWQPFVGTVTGLAGLGTLFTNFGSIEFEAGAQWSIAGDTSGLAGRISGFTTGDTIEMTGVTATASAFAGGILTLDETAGSATLDLPGSISLAEFDVTPVSGGTEVTFVACFAAGTRMLTATGERAVEALAPGDRVVTLSSRLRPVLWIGYRRVKCASREDRPVRVHADAFAAGMPHRDLVLSPDHAVLVDGVLVPARYLINGRTIVREPLDAVHYYHVELASHDVLLAEGLPCESYLDTGNRAGFGDGVLSVAAAI